MLPPGGAHVTKVSDPMATEPPDLSKTVEWSAYIAAQHEDISEANSMYREAKEFLQFYDWCAEIKESFVGMVHPGIVAVFLFHIVPLKADIDDWVWVIAGDLPPAYITTDECPNPATALDGYIGAMLEWVDAAQKGGSVASLIPVNLPATRENALKLKTRLDFLDSRILPEYEGDLKASLCRGD